MSTYGYGVYTTRRGTDYHYKLWEDGSMEVWVPGHSIRKRTGGWKMGPERLVDPTKELLLHIAEKYNFDYETLKSVNHVTFKS